MNNVLTFGLFLVLNDNLVVQIPARCETVCFLSKIHTYITNITYINEHLNQESTVFFVAYGIKRLNGDFLFGLFLVLNYNLVVQAPK